ncbi:MAG: YggS family pyridoxal phosphate-dependent enzyme [Bacteroidota bacterium]
MNSIKDRISSITAELPQSCTLVAVSKTKPTNDIMEAYASGQRDFGENKVQELAAKAEELPKDINWHMIGHLQRNKVKYIAPFIHLIHGVDTEKLLVEINKQGLKNGRTINCLLQVHIAKESTKFGFSEAEIKTLIESTTLKEMSNIRIVGLMGMASNVNDDSVVSEEFGSLEKLFHWMAGHSTTANVAADVLSTGMSNDYPLALKKGSNMVRIGSAIFGPRNY